MDSNHPAPPLWQRLLTILTQRAQTLECDTLQISHRPLATELGCSPAMLPRLMRRLEELGAIERIPFKNGFLVELTGRVIDHSIGGDRSPDHGVIDHCGGVIDHPPSKSPDRTPLRRAADHGRPQRDALMESGIQDSDSGRQAAADADIVTADWEALGVNSKIVPELLAFNLTPGRFRELVSQASKIRSVERPVGFVIGQLRSGRLSPAAPREDSHGSPARRPAHADRRDHRRAGGSRRAAERPTPREPAAPVERITDLPLLDLAAFGLDPDGRPLRV